MSRLSALLLAVSLATSAFAGCIDHKLLPRRAQNSGIHNHGLVARQAVPTDEASAAISIDPTTECTPYGYAPVTSMVSSYPFIWEIANLTQASTSTDTVAIALFQALNASIPNIPVKGLPDGNFSDFTPTYSPTDPDCWWSWDGCTTPKLAGLSDDITKCPEPETWGYGFDDGPNCSHNAFYDYLASEDQRATLFYIGSNVFDWPLQGQRGIDDGHEVCVHTWSHNYMTALTNEQAFAELYYSKKAIKDVLGITPQCWRPPYGDVDDRIRYIAQALGMATIVWVFDTDDWKVDIIGAQAVYNNYADVIAGGTNGTYSTYGPIVLTHELTNFTMSTAMTYYPQIKAAFKQVTPIAVCYNNSRPYIEQEYIYPNYEQWVSGVRSGSIPSATASVNAAISLPLTAGETTSIFVSLAYESPLVTQGVSATGSIAGTTTIGPSGSTSGTSSATTTATKKSGAFRRAAIGGAEAGVLAMVGVAGVAAAFVLGA